MAFAPPQNLETFAALNEITRTLRGPGGCPWDREQTFRTLTRFAIEEAYEWAMAVDQKNIAEMRGELGDMLFQVTLNAELAREAGHFTIEDVLREITEKMIRRHPHVYGDATAENSTEVLKNWAQIKAKESVGDGPSEKVGPTKPLFNIPAALPALIRAQKIGEKSGGHNFDFSGPEACWEKVEEEIDELKRARTPDEVQAEFGDVLFSLVQWARHSGLDAEQALRTCNARFENRFTWAQRAAREDGRSWMELEASEREAYWENAKRAIEP